MVYIDPSGMGPELPEGKYVKAITSFNLNIFSALFFSNNTSNKQLYTWAIGQNPAAYNKLKGAVGEGISLTRLQKAGFLTAYLGGRQGLLQVDIQHKQTTGIFLRYFEKKAQVRNNNFDGSVAPMAYFGGKNKEIYTMNFEVKTLSQNADVSTLFSNLSTGIEQTIARGQGENNIGILMTDADAWLKVANDPFYGTALKQLYNKLKSTGNFLRLEKGLNTEVERALHGLKDKINATE